MKTFIDLDVNNMYRTVHMAPELTAAEITSQFEYLKDSYKKILNASLSGKYPDEYTFKPATLPGRDKLAYSIEQARFSWCASLPALIPQNP